MSIKLSDVFPIENLQQYKLHLACWDGYDQPLNVFVRSRKEWIDWNSWRGKKDDFNRTYIFSLIDIYYEANTWLFGGVYEVLSRKPQNDSHSYKVKLVKDSQELIGRLKVLFKRPGRVRAVCLENYYRNVIV